MDLLSIIVIAIGLAMDCFAVSIAKGMAARKFYFRYALRTALLFGLFQGLMPLIGYLAGISFAETIAVIDHWIAFVLLGFIGTKMIVESMREKDGSKNRQETRTEDIATLFSWKILFSLAIATSIDALATGLIFVPTPEWTAVAFSIIGAVSFLFSMLGMWIGATFGKRFRLNVEVIGGIILILIGTKILIEHLLCG